MTSGIGRRRAAARDEGGEEYRQRRAEIVRAAAGIFKEHGFRATKLGDVAEALNMDRASLYYYVGGKEELFHEVVGGAVAANADAAEAIRQGPGTAPEKLRALVTGLMVSYAESYPFLYVYIQENLSTVSRDRSPGPARCAGTTSATRTRSSRSCSPASTRARCAATTPHG